ncbi:MAG: hypothetical protein IJ124_13450 [Clostridia bacterium]|nr:hypothetical protein [Clostridia bacterium]
MVGEAVAHVRFGKGSVISFEPPRIVIAFDNGEEKTFAYPQSVGRFIRFERDEVQQRAEQDRSRAEIIGQELEMARLQEKRRQAEEADRLRIESLREKKVAAAKRTAAMRKTKTGGNAE